MTNVEIANIIWLVIAQIKESAPTMGESQASVIAALEKLAIAFSKAKEP